MTINMLFKVKDIKGKVTSKIYGYQNIPEAIDMFNHFVHIRTHNIPIHMSGLGDFWIVGRIKFEMEE